MKPFILLRKKESGSLERRARRRKGIKNRRKVVRVKCNWYSLRGYVYHP